MEYQVFLYIFQKNSAMATLGLKEMGKSKQLSWFGKCKKNLVLLKVGWTPCLFSSQTICYKSFLYLKNFLIFHCLNRFRDLKIFVNSQSIEQFFYNRSEQSSKLNTISKNLCQTPSDQVSDQILLIQKNPKITIACQISFRIGKFVSKYPKTDFKRPTTKKLDSSKLLF